MAKRAKLKDALDRHRGVDHKLEQQKRQQKKALKRKRVQQDDEDGERAVEADSNDMNAVPSDSKRQKKVKSTALKLQPEESSEDDAEELTSSNEEEWETAEEDIMHTALDLSRLQDSDTSDSEQEGLNEGVKHAKFSTNGLSRTTNDRIAGGDDEEEGDDIPLSDIESLASEDRADVIPHQRLTINNLGALTQAYKSIALPSSLPFSAMQAVTSEDPTEIADIDDDLKRESAFYKQSLDAVVKARALLKKEGVPFSRPADYFAEMVKTDEHMGKIKKKLVDDAAGKKASAEARRQRDLKKFGKQVQIAKLQERAKEKKTTLDQIKMLKRKRSGASIGNEKEDDLFDVALEDAADTQQRDKAARRASGTGGPNAKRTKKNEKYGYGGKKRFSKSNDATSSADTRGFSVKKMKAKTKARPGKSKRSKAR